MGQKLDLLSLTARGCRFLCGFKRVRAVAELSSPGGSRGAQRSLALGDAQTNPCACRPLRALGLDRSFQER